MVTSRFSPFFSRPHFSQAHFSGGLSRRTGSGDQENVKKNWAAEIMQTPEEAAAFELKFELEQRAIEAYDQLKQDEQEQAIRKAFEANLKKQPILDTEQRKERGQIRQATGHKPKNEAEGTTVDHTIKKPKRWFNRFG